MAGRRESKCAEYFNRDPLDNNYVVCQICVRERAKKPARYKLALKVGPTTQLTDHLESNHKVAAGLVEVSPLDKAVSNMVLHHDISYNFIDCSCLADLVRTADKT
jgi:hypothetical protein